MVTELPNICSGFCIEDAKLLLMALACDMSDALCSWETTRGVVSFDVWKYLLQSIISTLKHT
jgi:hypothetical protein